MSTDNLIERIEAAEGPSRELFEEAFVVVRGPKPPRVYGGSDELTVWLHKHNPFYKMLELGTWLDAALTLLPEGWLVDTLGECLRRNGPWTAILARRGRERSEARADHAALALLAAILRTRKEAQ